MAESKKNRLVDTVEKQAKRYLFDRQKAYQKVFGGKDVATKTVLTDMRRFCRADQSCFDPDARIHAVFEGRREVAIRILHHLDLKPDELWKLYGESNA